MAKFKLLAVAAILSTAIATPGIAQQAVQIGRRSIGDGVEFLARIDAESIENNQNNRLRCAQNGSLSQLDCRLANRCCGTDDL